MRFGRAVIVAIALSLIAGGTVHAHERDRFTAKQAGPIDVGKTTLDQTTKWFGDPSVTKKVQRGCVKVTMARWGKSLKMYHYRIDGELEVAEVWVWRRTVTSTKHGDLTMHTIKGLRVGDSLDRLLELYPEASKYKYKGKTFYELRPATPSKGRLRAVVKDEKVRGLINAPWEYC
jgi:hypothetical protein